MAVFRFYPTGAKNSNPFNMFLILLEMSHPFALKNPEETFSIGPLNSDNELRLTGPWIECSPDCALKRLFEEKLTKDEIPWVRKKYGGR